MTNIAVDEMLNSEEIDAIKASVNRFIQQQVQHNWPTWVEQKTIPRSYIKALGDAGYFSSDLPEAYGGSNAGFAYSAEIIKAFCREGHFVHGGLLISQQLMVAHMLNSPRVSTQIKEQVLTLVAAGDIIPALAMTEPQGGSDLLNIRCEAKRVNNGYIINGSKTFISNAHLADIFILAARTTPIAENRKGLTLFLVDANTPGVEVGNSLSKIGMQAADTAELFLNDVVVSEQSILGELDGGVTLLMEGLPRERCYAGICASAICEGALKLTKDYVNDRVLFGKPMSQLQNTGFEMADMVADWRLLDAFISSAIRQMHYGQLSSEAASIARLKGVQMVMAIVERCALLFGGYGFMAEYPIAQLWSDVRGMAFWGGPNEIMKEIIARQFLS